MEFQGISGKAKVRVIRTIKVPIRIRRKGEGLEEKEETRTRVIFKGSFNAYNMWAKTHQMTADDRLEVMDKDKIATPA